MQADGDARDYETSNLKHPSLLFTGPFGAFHKLPFVKRIVSKPDHLVVILQLSSKSPLA
jgi:hypothetical protein